MNNNILRRIDVEAEPTLENVEKIFVVRSLHRLLFEKDYPCFRIDFKEPEALKSIETVLKKDQESFDNYLTLEGAMHVLEELKKHGAKQDIDDLEKREKESPVLIVRKYSDFIEQLRIAYEKYIDLRFLDNPYIAINRPVATAFFELLWLRATAYDFSNPEIFLRKQIQMMSDQTFKQYDQETSLGAIDYLDGHIFCVQNGVAKVYDESPREFRIIIYDKRYYDTLQRDKAKYKLPLIRYGIYQRDGKKVCCIGSIQNKSSNSDSYGKDDSLKTQLDKQRSNINKGVSWEDRQKVEPKKLLALSIFVNFLSRAGITDIEIPSLYSLDYEYHTIQNNKMLEEFKHEWSTRKQELMPEVFGMAQRQLNEKRDKMDLISEVKTERFLLTFRRLLLHYPKGQILSYPDDGDGYMRIRIPTIKDENDINGSVLREFFKFLHKSKEIEF